MKPPRKLHVRATEKAPVGIAGLDEIACGGLPRGRATLLTGGVGAGKSILALQSLAVLKTFCHPHLTGRLESGIVDGLSDTVRAWADGIVLTSTNFKGSSSSACKILGALGECYTILLAFGLAT